MARPRKPTALHLLEGTDRPGRIRDIPKAKISNKLPKPPNELGKLGRQFWRKYGPAWHAAGVITEIDLAAWYVLCEVWDRYRFAISKLRRPGRLTDKPSARMTEMELVEYTRGGSKKSPWLAIVDQQHDRYVILLKEFGMTKHS
jgi:P27 family predicted phage terminase small subunit